MIGILDWGIGGLDLFRRLRTGVSTLPVVYLSDTGYAPYGKVPASELAARITLLACHFRALGVERLVLACNAASTLLPRLGVSQLSGRIATPRGVIEVTGVIAHAVRIARGTHGILGVVGGYRTIRSGIYRRALTGRRVIQRIAQPLSAHVEAGRVASDSVRRDLSRIVAPLRRVDQLLLACTHYPALAPLFQEQLPRVTLLDPADALARWVVARWGKHTAPGADRFFTTGDRRSMQRAAAAAWGLELGRIEELRLR